MTMMTMTTTKMITREVTAMAHLVDSHGSQFKGFHERIGTSRLRTNRKPT